MEDIDVYDGGEEDRTIQGCGKYDKDFGARHFTSCDACQYEDDEDGCKGLLKSEGHVKITVTVYETYEVEQGWRDEENDNHN